MNELKGSDYVLQIEDPETAGTYNTLGGLKSKSMTLNNESVDVTNHGSSGWRELLNGAGIKSLDASGEGVTQNVATLKNVLDMFRVSQHMNLRMLFQQGDANVIRVTMRAQITSIEFSAENDKEVPYSISFANAAEPDFEVF